MNVVINGEKKEIRANLNLRELLVSFELPTERVAVELNKTVVRKKDWETIIVGEMDHIEVVHFVGGG